MQPRRRLRLGAGGDAFSGSLECETGHFRPLARREITRRRWKTDENHRLLVRKSSFNDGIPIFI